MVVCAASAAQKKKAAFLSCAPVVAATGLLLFLMSGCNCRIEVKCIGGSKHVRWFPEAGKRLALLMMLQPPLVHKGCTAPASASDENGEWHRNRVWPSGWRSACLRGMRLVLCPVC